MTSQRVNGCSACLITAIERRNYVSIREMLSNRKLYFRDTLWLPIRYGSYFIKAIELSPVGIRFLSSIPSHLAYPPWQCHHPFVKETYDCGSPEACAISVIVMAMLCSTPEFNALKILIDSDRFDLREPLLFHICQSNSYYEMDWRLVCINPLGMALLLDAFKYNEREHNFFLTRTLLDASLGSIDNDFYVMECYENGWSAFRTRGPIGFFYHCILGVYSVASFLEGNVPSKLAQIGMLCEIGFELNSPLLCNTRYKHGNENRLVTETRSITLLNAFSKIFEYDIQSNHSYYNSNSSEEF